MKWFHPGVGVYLPTGMPVASFSLSLSLSSLTGARARGRSLALTRSREQRNVGFW